MACPMDDGLKFPRVQGTVIERTPEAGSRVRPAPFFAPCRPRTSPGSAAGWRAIRPRSASPRKEIQQHSGLGPRGSTRDVVNSSQCPSRIPTPASAPSRTRYILIRCASRSFPRCSNQAIRSPSSSRMVRIARVSPGASRTACSEKCSGLEGFNVLTVSGSNRVKRSI